MFCVGSWLVGRDGVKRKEERSKVLFSPVMIDLLRVHLSS